MQIGTHVLQARIHAFFLASSQGLLASTWLFTLSHQQHDLAWRHGRCRAFVGPRQSLAGARRLANRGWPSPRAPGWPTKRGNKACRAAGDVDVFANQIGAFTRSMKSSALKSMSSFFG